MPKPLREQYAEAIEELGYRRMETRSERYWVFFKYDRYRPPYLFVGKAGSVRGGRTKRFDLSFPLSPDAKASLLKKGGTAQT